MPDPETVTAAPLDREVNSVLPADPEAPSHAYTQLTTWMIRACGFVGPARRVRPRACHALIALAPAIAAALRRR
jgi:hypothetical protein